MLLTTYETKERPLVVEEVKKTVICPRKIPFCRIYYLFNATRTAEPVWRKERGGGPFICAADRTDMGVRCSLTEGQKLHRNNRSTTDKRDVVLMFTPPPPHFQKALC